MRHAAPRWLLTACLVCAGLQAGGAAAQGPRAADEPGLPVRPFVPAPWPPAYQNETDLAKLEQALRQAQARAAGFDAKAADLDRTGRQAEAAEATRQADEARAIERAIQARIAGLKGLAAELARPAPVRAIAPLPAPVPPRPVAETGVPPPPPPSPQPVTVAPARPPAAGKTAAAPPRHRAPAAAADSPDATLAADSAQIDSLVKGSAEVNAPDKAKVGATFFVYLRVTPDKLAKVLKSLRDAHPENAVDRNDIVSLTPRMTATVSGQGFEVSPNGAQVQAVSSTDVTEWQWQVTPTASGSHTLTVTLDGILVVQGTDAPHNFLAANEAIEVAVGPWDWRGFIANNWQWLASTIAIPAFGALWAVLRRRGEPAAARADAARPRRRQRVDGA